jgi:hypothetical protein
VQFSWIVVALGVLGVLVVLAAESFTAAPAGEAGRGHHHLRWYSALPLLAWVLAIGAAAYPAFNA